MSSSPKDNNENTIIYYYNFDTLEFTIDIFSYDEDSNEFLGLKKVLNSSIENVKLSSDKEMENFGDKVINMALFT